MKRRISLIILIGICATLCCVAFSACNPYLQPFESYENVSSYSVASSGTCNSPFDALDIEWFNGSVNINYGDVDEPEFKEIPEGGKISYDTTLRYKFDDNTLLLKYAKSGKMLNESGMKKHLYVTLPNGAQMQSINVRAVSAYVQVLDVVVTNLDVKNVSGNVYIKCEARVVNVKNTSGLLHVGGEATTVNADNVSGSCEFYYAALPASIVTNTVSGNVEFKLDVVWGFKIEFNTTSGKAVFVNSFQPDLQSVGNGFIYRDGGNSLFVINCESSNLTIGQLPREE